MADGENAAETPQETARGLSVTVRLDSVEATLLEAAKRDTYPDMNNSQIFREIIVTRLSELAIMRARR